MADQTRKILPFKKPLVSTIECCKNLQFMHKLPSASMQLIVTSPPYNLGKEYELRRSLEIYQEEQAAAIGEAVRLLHPNGSICWQVGNYVEDGEIFPLDAILYPMFKVHGLHLREVVFDGCI